MDLCRHGALFSIARVLCNEFALRKVMMEEAIEVTARLLKIISTDTPCNS